MCRRTALLFVLTLMAAGANGQRLAGWPRLLLTVGNGGLVGAEAGVHIGDTYVAYQVFATVAGEGREISRAESPFAPPFDGMERDESKAVVVGRVFRLGLARLDVGGGIGVTDQVRATTRITEPYSVGTYYNQRRRSEAAGLVQARLSPFRYSPLSVVVHGHVSRHSTWGRMGVSLGIR